MGAPCGPVLVVVAHPDDEALAFAGVIAAARSEGRPVTVAVVTNGDSPVVARALPRGGAAAGAPARTLGYGLRRGGETVAAMSLLGLRWDRDPSRSQILLLGYPNLGLEAVASAESPWTDDPTGLHRTYAWARGLARPRTDGDLRRLYDGTHSRLAKADLERDLDTVVELAGADDVFTHAAFDGHPDHAEVHRQVVAALERCGRRVTLHSALVHPEGTGRCMYRSALRWPNPADGPGGPAARFTPGLSFEPPPVPPDAERPTGLSWGPLGPPDEALPVPAPMRDPDPARNLKWRVISRYTSQLRCRPAADGTVHASCGYLRAFVKREEVFWTRRVGTVP